MQITANGSVNGTSNYKFWIQNGSQWQIVQFFSSKNYFDWKPSSPGTYRLCVDVKDNTGNMISKWVYYDIK
ncbi:MAG: hypothetical protein RR782_09240 [Clostridium sp.]